ncbi:hypothetical protein, partial [Streptomyces sp. ID05-47C]|uniref:hypothetical protein n=1 Tax=Streptomyces sp. ID05-47C TaxID=3028665 RepID=UPI0029B24D43
MLTVAMGTTTASQALGWERPWAAQTQSSTLSPAHDDDKDKDKHHSKGKGDKYDLVHSCKGGTFGYCTQNAVFAPKILGDIGLTTGLIGLTNGTPAAAAGTPAAAAPAAAAPAAAGVPAAAAG